MLLFNNDSFCSSGFKCSGPSRAIEKMIWAAIEKFADHWCKVTTTNSIQTQYGITLRRTVIGVARGGPKGLCSSPNFWKI